MRLSDIDMTKLPLPPGKTDHIIWDDDMPSFGVRLRPTKRVFVVQYRVGHQQRRESLGDVRKISIGEARKIARQRFAQVELGIDPAAQRAQARAQAAATKLTLATVTPRYLDAKFDVLRASTYKAAERYLTQCWKPLHDRPIEAIKRADVAARLQELTKAHGRTSAARARDTLSALFGWAMREGLCEANPVIATNDPTEGIQPRDRVLGDTEIGVIWNACQDDDFGRIVRLLLLTGCRRDEIGGLKWAEVDLDTGVMTIPGTRTKNGRMLELALPAVAIEILQSAPQRHGRDYVFGSRGMAFSAWSASKLRLDAKIAIATGRALAPWRLHDLRRTMRTGLGKLGIAPHVAELAINHVKGGVEAIYDRHRYQPEIKTALAMWAEHVLAVVEGRSTKVTSMRRA
jgi:integrase